MRRVTIALCAAAFVLVAAPAQGASVSGGNGEVLYNADEGEKNNLTVKPNGAEFEVTDSGAQVTVGDGCRSEGPFLSPAPPPALFPDFPSPPPVAAEGAVIRCTKTRLARVFLKDGDDTASVTGFPDGFKPRIVGGSGNDTLRTGLGAEFFGGAGDDVLEGGPGEDILDADGDFDEAGRGNDTIRARGGGRDFVDCGPGNDSAEVDATDVPAADSDPDGGCEGGVLLRPTLEFVPVSATVSKRSRVIRVPVKCSKADCFGKVRLVSGIAFGPRTKAVRFRGISARVRFKKGRRSATVRLRLSRREHAVLRGIARRGGELDLIATLRDSAGHVQQSGAGVSL